MLGTGGLVRIADLAAEIGWSKAGIDDHSPPVLAAIVIHSCGVFVEQSKRLVERPGRQQQCQLAETQVIGRAPVVGFLRCAEHCQRSRWQRRNGRVPSSMAGCCTRWNRRRQR